MRLILIAALLLSQDSVEKLIEKLGDDDVEVREKASAEIIKIGKPALEALGKAAKSDKQEIASRAKALIATIDFPDAGPESKGLALAIKAEKEYKADGKLVLRGRIKNVSDQEITLGPIDLTESEDWLLKFANNADEYHLCFRPGEPGPDVKGGTKIAKGQTLEFIFSPRAWCYAIEHSKCGPFPFAEGDYTFTIALNGFRGEGWKGKAVSNEVRFSVKK